MLEILYEDNHIIVVLKPQNVPSQSDDSGDPDMLTIVKQFLKDKYDKKGNVFLGLVHRLDRPTGGIMVFAKTSKAASRLSASLKNGDFSKKYFAVVNGRPRENKRILIDYLVKDPETNTVKVVPPSTEGAKRAELSYSVLDSVVTNEGFNLTLADIELKTGRSHQIRAQFKNMGNPLFGDAKYGGAVIKGENLSLFAYHLAFPHPTLNQTMVFRAFPPETAPWTFFNIEKYYNIKIPKNKSIYDQLLPISKPVVVDFSKPGRDFEYEIDREIAYSKGEYYLYDKEENILRPNDLPYEDQKKEDN